MSYFFSSGSSGSTQSINGITVGSGMTITQTNGRTIISGGNSSAESLTITDATTMKLKVKGTDEVIYEGPAKSFTLQIDGKDVSIGVLCTPLEITCESIRLVKTEAGNVEVKEGSVDSVNTMSGDVDTNGDIRQAKTMSGDITSSGTITTASSMSGDITGARRRGR